ncbi:transposase [Arthrobacter sp. UYEF3]
MALKRKIGWLSRHQILKQRHTAKRIFDRLVEEHGFTGTYSPVQRHVKKWSAANRQPGEGFTELVWPAGTVQVDFGQAEAIIAGIRQVLHILVVTFPFSNMRFVQAYRGETAECVAHGLRTVFEHIGAAPRHMVFDNATGIGNRVGTRVTETKLFGAFKLHYGSESRYCNPYSGHEKGNVENAVGFLRRNFMVPEPEAATLEGLNKVLMARCDALATTRFSCGFQRRGLLGGEGAPDSVGGDPGRGRRCPQARPAGAEAADLGRLRPGQHGRTLGALLHRRQRVGIAS